MRKLVAGLVSMFVLVHAASGAEAITAAVFVAKASEAGLAEIQLGQLAAQKASAPAVRQYGQRMVADHGKADAELKPLAEKKQLPTTKALNPAHQKALDTLKQKTGADFDTAYAQQMVADHDEAVALFSAGAALSDKDLAAFAANTLPTLRDHQRQAGALHGVH